MCTGVEVRTSGEVGALKGKEGTQDSILGILVKGIFA